MGAEALELVCWGRDDANVDARTALTAGWHGGERSVTPHGGSSVAPDEASQYE